MPDPTRILVTGAAGSALVDEVLGIGQRLANGVGDGSSRGRG